MLELGYNFRGNGVLEMGFFKKEESLNIGINKNTKDNFIEDNINNQVKCGKTLSLFKEETIQYVIEKFPSMSIEIQKSLLDVSTVLENTIDHIEDKSSKLIKDSRNFELSQQYRDTCISIYKVVENIRDYVQWMKDEGNKNTEEKEDKNDSKEEKEIMNEEEVKSKDISKDISDDEVNTVNIELEIYKDFSGKEPKGFEIDNDIILVDGWDDLLVKTAEILTKQYKQNRHSNIIVKPVKVVEKKSQQNEFRDTVIEMLNEYKINLRDFKIIVK